AAVLSVVIDIAPVKFSPWKWIFRQIGNMLMPDIREDIRLIKNELQRQGTDIDENEMDAIRWEVLNFANECRIGRKHTKEQFDHVLAQEKKYRRLLEKNNRDNGVFDQEFKFILEIYHACQQENAFL
ncbi:MAG: hypothetical protein IJP02_00215, partial [Oscillospiraceae bacterium]|nr:hypothetical protein [Oscillospiraceae bacterium]